MFSKKKRKIVKDKINAELAEMVTYFKEHPREAFQCAPGEADDFAKLAEYMIFKLRERGGLL